MKKFLIAVALVAASFMAKADDIKVLSPDGKLQVTISQNDKGGVVYNVMYDSKVILEESPLGLITNDITSENANIIGALTAIRIII